ncbi:hypothetical protein jhhlp_002981 [Lomentospora prolificans]|uniref:DASH complex subunit SPC34 n=1 Tax=Lomentospora prolificans TaxID=41688 RepID=A0A2N3NFJ7_9PEZI|nr:hypothetical protein jhhlp_002981 [Lomentospora prolificans]
MSLLSAHLEQIAYSCEGIDSLPFHQRPPLESRYHHLRDRATSAPFFRTSPPASTTPAKATEEPSRASSRRQTVFNVSSGEVTTGGPPTRASARRNTAVAAVLGAPMHERLRRSELSSKDDVDVEILLRGAEKLCGVYALPGAQRRIAELRGREADLASTMAYYEAKVAEQAEALEAMSKDWRDDDYEDDEEEEEDYGQIVTDEQLRAEEEEVRELERKKRDLQERLRAMDKDIGGLLRM